MYTTYCKTGSKIHSIVPGTKKMEPDIIRNINRNMGFHTVSSVMWVDKNTARVSGEQCSPDKRHFLETGRFSSFQETKVQCSLLWSWFMKYNHWIEG